MLETIIQEVNAVAWGLPMLILLLGTGIYLTLGLGFMTLRKVPRAVSLLFSGVSGRGEGDIVPFKALMTSLSATIGTGNIAGVATAITLGGPVPCSGCGSLRYSGWRPSTLKVSGGSLPRAR